MPLVAYRTEIKATASAVWALLLDKIERPDKHVPGVQSVEILRRFGPTSVERAMMLGEGAAARRVHELITADASTMTVVFKLKDDPLYIGFVLNTVFDEGGHVALDYTLHWTPKSGKEPENGPDLRAVIERAVLHAKTTLEGAP